MTDKVDTKSPSARAADEIASLFTVGFCDDGMVGDFAKVIDNHIVMARCSECGKTSQPTSMWALYCVDCCERLLFPALAKTEQDLSNVPFAIIFDDHDVRHEIVVGEAGARARFARISDNWNAHLFVKVQSNTRDDSYHAKNARICGSTSETSEAAHPDAGILQVRRIEGRRARDSAAWRLDELAGALYLCITDSPMSQTTGAPARIAAINTLVCDALRAAGYDTAKGSSTRLAQAATGNTEPSGSSATPGEDDDESRSSSSDQNAGGQGGRGTDGGRNPATLAGCSQPGAGPCDDGVGASAAKLAYPEGQPQSEIRAASLAPFADAMRAQGWPERMFDDSESLTQYERDLRDAAYTGFRASQPPAPEAEIDEFSCPQCGSHWFRTLGNRGQCKGCGFTWERRTHDAEYGLVRSSRFTAAYPKDES